jgi:hypothetical protein
VFSGAYAEEAFGEVEGSFQSDIATRTARGIRAGQTSRFTTRTYLISAGIIFHSLTNTHARTINLPGIITLITKIKLRAFLTLIITLLTQRIRQIIIIPITTQTVPRPQSHLVPLLTPITGGTSRARSTGETGIVTQEAGGLLVALVVVAGVAGAGVVGLVPCSEKGIVAGGAVGGEDGAGAAAVVAGLAGGDAGVVEAGVAGAGGASAGCC